MNTSCQYHLQYFLAESSFPACQKSEFLLQAHHETAMAPFRGGEVLAFTSLFERWFLSTDSQAGDFLPRLIRGSGGTSNCGLRDAEALNIGFDKITEMKALENIVEKMNIFRPFALFNTLLRGFLRENPGAKTNTNNPQIITESNLSI